MRYLTLVPALALAACGSSEPEPVAEEARVALPQAPVVQEAPPQPDAAASPTPPPEPEAAAGTARAAVAVVRDYLARLEAGDQGGASRLWEGEATASERFASAVAGLGTPEVGEPGAIEAGAGQRYITVPVRFSAAEDGAEASRLAKVVLHRAGDIDGASIDQRRWRIRSAELAEAAAAAPPTVQPDHISAAYRCNDDSDLVADFDNDEGTVTLRRNGYTVSVLQQQRAASGIWYAGNGFELRGKGAEATFTAPDAPPLTCTAD